MGTGASADATKAIQDNSAEDLKSALAQMPTEELSKIRAALDSKTKVKIHGLTLSANCMGPLLFATATDCGELKPCNIMAGEQMTPEFLKLNGFHKIPTLEGADGFSLGESVAILQYLARQHAPQFYPENDAKLTARIDWCMDAMGKTVYPAWGERAYAVLGFHEEPDDKAKANEKLKSALDMFCATFLGEGKFVCGDLLTIADYKALPYLFVLSDPILKQKAGVALSPRLEQYVRDVMDAVPSSSMLKEAGGYALEEFLKTKTDKPDWEGDVTICGEGSCGEFAKGAAKEEEKEAKIWGMPVSTTACGAIMLAKDAGIGDMALCNLMEGEQLKPEFLAKNPFHTIPTYEGSDGFTLGESSSILRLLARNYKAELYPEDVKERAKVDWGMEAAQAVYSKLGPPIFYPVLGFAAPPADQSEANKAATTVLDEFASTLLGDGKFVCGDKLTLVEYKLLPHLFGVSQPVVKQKTGFELPERWVKYMDDAMAAIGSSTFLTEGACGMSVKGFAASKEE